MGSHVSVGSQIVAISFLRLPPQYTSHIWCHGVHTSYLISFWWKCVFHNVQKNSLQKYFWTFMKALCVSCVGRYLFWWSLAKVCHFSSETERGWKNTLPNNSMGSEWNENCVCLFSSFVCEVQLAWYCVVLHLWNIYLKRPRLTYYWHYKVLINWYWPVGLGTYMSAKCLLAHILNILNFLFNLQVSIWLYLCFLMWDKTKMRWLLVF